MEQTLFKEQEARRASGRVRRPVHAAGTSILHIIGWAGHSRKSFDVLRSQMLVKYHIRYVRDPSARGETPARLRHRQ